MGNLSSKLTTITFGVADPNNRPTLQRGTITNFGTTPYTFSAGDSGTTLRLGNANQTAVFYAEGGVWNALWNDIADFQLLNDELVFGKCYYDTIEGAKICNSRCQLSVIGIASDTFGMCVGSGANHTEVPLAVSGWVLAYVDNEYECGTPLTNDENGNLTEISMDEKRNYPERIVAIYKKKEHEKLWGSAGRKVEVNGRHWVKVK